MHARSEQLVGPVHPATALGAVLPTQRAVLMLLCACVILVEPLLCLFRCPDPTLDFGFQPGRVETAQILAVWTPDSEAVVGTVAHILERVVATVSTLRFDCTLEADGRSEDAPAGPHSSHTHEHHAALSVVVIATSALLVVARSCAIQHAVPSIFRAPPHRPPLQHST